MRRFLTLVFLVCLAVPAGISVSGCSRNPGANYCNGLGYGANDTDVSSIVLQPQTTGISLAFGQTQQLSSPQAKTCKGAAATVATYTYGTTNNQLVDISPTGNLCAGTWNRNSGGGIGNYTICNKPNPFPSNNGLPFGIAYVTATGQAVSSNPVEVYVHPQVTSVTLVGPQECLSQGQEAQLDAQACYEGANNQQLLLCAPSSVTQANYACAPPTGATIANCSGVIGNLSYFPNIGSIATINAETNQITAQQPGTTEISASVAGGSSSAGYFSTCPPKSITLTLANGSTQGTITKGVQQNLVTTVLDTNNLPITGLVLDYQSTDPIDITANVGGSIATNFPGVASIYAICQPSTCNPAPVNQIGQLGTGLPIASNPVTVTTPGTASDYVWFAAPGQSQYFVPIELLTGTVGSPVRLPYVPNSMVMDRLGNNLYFGSARELMIYNTVGNQLSKTDINVPGVVLAVSPDNSMLLINDQQRQVFYIYSTANTSASINTTNGGVGNAAAWTPDSKTLYITDNASLGAPHTDTLYVYSASTSWTSYPLPPSPLPVPPSGLLPPNVAVTGTVQTPALTIPSVGAYLRGSPTEAHTWCPSGTVGSVAFYPLGDSVPVRTDTLASTTDGQHILGATLVGSGITLYDIGVTIPSSTQCPGAGSNTLTPLTIQHTVNQAALSLVNATAVDQVVASPASNLAFITYSGSTAGATLPYYVPGTGGAVGMVGSVPLGGGSASAITAPVAGAFTPDDTLFFVSTAGDNLVHYISVPLVTSNPAKADTQQIAPNLPACTPVAQGGLDPGCALAAPTTNPVPATVIVVKPRSTT